MEDTRESDENVKREVELILSITTEELISFLSERKAEHVCEACGTNSEWVVRNTGAKPVLTQAPFYTDSGHVEAHFSVFCPHCGNTRLFNARFVASCVYAVRSAGNGKG
jgi:hypothetical protein